MKPKFLPAMLSFPPFMLSSRSFLSHFCIIFYQINDFRNGLCVCFVNFTTITVILIIFFRHICSKSSLEKCLLKESIITSLTLISPPERCAKHVSPWFDTETVLSQPITWINKWQFKNPAPYYYIILDLVTKTAAGKQTVTLFFPAHFPFRCTLSAVSIL